MMKNTDDILEILIGKYIDGEISPTEQYMLDEKLKRDSQARELFEQLKDLHSHSQEAIEAEVLDHGKTAEEVFEQAWRQQAKSPLRLIIPKYFGMSSLRFAAGLAAGLIIGLTLHFTLFSQSTPAPPATRVIATDTGNRAGRLSIQPVRSGENVIRDVDWYSFEDDGGQEWLIERIRQDDVVRPAAYSQGL